MYMYKAAMYITSHHTSIILLQARVAMTPITTAGKRMIASSSALIQTAKPLAINPKDPPTWQLLANHSKNVSDSIKELIASIRLASFHSSYSISNILVMMMKEKEEINS